jgi:hypothetical protein
MEGRETISFFEGEKSMGVNVACQRVTGTGLDTLFCIGWPASKRVKWSPTNPNESRQIRTHPSGSGVTGESGRVAGSSTKRDIQRSLASPGASISGHSASIKKSRYPAGFSSAATLAVFDRNVR